MRSWLAHHYVEALELAQRLGDHEQVPELRSRAVASLALAGDGARTLDLAKAESLYQRALAFATNDDPIRGRVLGRLGITTQFLGQSAVAERCYAVRRSRRCRRPGTSRGPRRSWSTSSRSSWRLGRSEEERRQLLLRAIAILESADAGSELVFAYSQMAALRAVRGPGSGVPGGPRRPGRPRTAWGDRG